MFWIILYIGLVNIFNIHFVVNQRILDWKNVFLLLNFTYIILSDKISFQKFFSDFMETWVLWYKGWCLLPCLFWGTGYRLCWSVYWCHAYIVKVFDIKIYFVLILFNNTEFSWVVRMVHILIEISLINKVRFHKYLR